MNQLMNFLQAASNSAASNVSGPVDLIADALRAAGVPVPRNALLSSEWMREKGLTAPVQQGASQVAGDTLSLLAPVVAAAKATQIARGLLSLDDKAMDMTRQGVERYMHRTGMMPGVVVSPKGTVPLKVTTLDGAKKQAPTAFYRGETPGADRVLTKDANWDSALFASDDPKKAALYGANVSAITAKPGANLLYEGSKEFQSLMKGVSKNQSMLAWASEATRRAKAAGFDAVWFKRQGDLGTAILDRAKFNIDGALINNTGGVR